MSWGSSSLRSCDNLLRRAESNDRTLTTLYILPSKTFDHHDVERLASAIDDGKNTRLTALSASGHSMSISSISRLAIAIASSHRKRNESSDTSHGDGLLSIALGDKSMGDEGMVAFCQPFHSICGGLLMDVDFSCKAIGMDGCKAIGGAFGPSLHLKRLNLSANDLMSDDGLVALCTSALDACRERNAKGGCNGFARNEPNGLFPSLQDLDLSQCNLGPRGVRALSCCLVLDYVSILDDIDRGGDLEESSETKISNVADASLTRDGGGINLTLSGNPSIGPKGLQHIGRMIAHVSMGSFLSTLKISNCGVGDAGILALFSVVKKGACNGLISLDLSHNGIGPSGAKAVAELLKLPSSSEENDGKEVRQMDGNRCFLSTLAELNFSCNKIGKDGVCAIAASLWQWIEMTRTNGSRHGNGTKSCDNATLQLICLSDTNCGPEGASAMLKCGAITLLRLFNNNLSPNGFRQIAPDLVSGHPSIVTLDLGGNNADDSSVSNLLKCILTENGEWKSSLRTLEIGGNQIGAETETVLKEMSTGRPELDVARDRPSASA